jgi:hypothetical protein
LIYTYFYILAPDAGDKKMSDTALTQNNTSEEMIEFENPFNGEVSLIKAEDIKEWESKRELFRLRLIAWQLSAPSHLARVAQDPEEWVMFASQIIGRGH